ncbi:MAG: alkaline phosphatase family protein [Thermomicrobiales bacterium]
MSDSPRVVLLSIDGLSHASVSPETTPHLWSLAAAGGRAPEGGRCDLPAVTYVSHATLATGTPPLTHGLTSNLAASPRPDVVPGWAGADQVQVPPIFAALRAAGLRSAAICGDQNLVGIMRTETADVVWPAGGVLPEGTPTCPSGYATNAAIREQLLAAVGDSDLDVVFGHLNEPDTCGHRFGPDDPRTTAAYQDADALVGEVVAAIGADWERTVLIVLSDHGMEAVTAPPVDLLAHDAVRAVVTDVVNDGGAALARLRDGVSLRDATQAVSAVTGVAGVEALRDGVLLVVGEPGTVFTAGASKHIRGMHGGPGTCVTIAVVGGGHPAVARIAAAIAARPPHLADWAPTVAAIVGAVMPTAEGRSLAG